MGRKPPQGDRRRYRLRCDSTVPVRFHRRGGPGVLPNLARWRRAPLPASGRAL